jgi:hypothetical protein
MAQLETTRGSTLKLMASAPFVRGFKEKMENRPMDYDCFLSWGETNNRWKYERGRLFACLFHGQLKQGNKITWQARAAMISAINCKAFI